MSLSSSLFTGTSGLTNMGNNMQVIGNNIANVNTVGFKRGRMTFSDTLSQSLATNAGTGQVGRGMAISSVDQNFGQGSFESTGNTTDLSIGGDGFFVLRQENADTNYYTRAGNFNFDKDGQLVSPEGYIVQGWELDPDTGDDIGAITDIVLSAFTSPPKQTEQITAITNLDSDADSKSVVLSNLWDSEAETVMDDNGFEYQTVVTVYDSLGTTHDLTIYYDKISGSKWEYVVACDPTEDQRNLVQDTGSLGLLARGEINFSQGSGNILSFTMEEFTGRIGNVQASGVNSQDDINFNIEDYEAMPLDGYNFSFEFNGLTWEFQDINQDGTVDANDLPDNYPLATIVYSDEQTIELSLSADGETDLTIRLAQGAVATDSISFDINDQNDLHVQGITGTTYTGDTENENTTLQINDPGVMTQDADDLRLIWYPVEEAWHWSNPVAANTAGTLVAESTLSTSNTAAVSTTGITTISNPGDLKMVSSDIKLRYNGTAWDWNMAHKLDDISNETFSFVPTNDPILSMSDPAGSDGVLEALNNQLTWDGSTWSVTASAASINMSVVSGSSSLITFAVWDATAATSAGATTFTYTFSTPLTTAAGQTIDFDIDPTPPEEYPNAVITTPTSGANSIGINFDGDTTEDIVFDVTSGATAALSAGDDFYFSVDPDVPPPEYSNAVLSGDKDKVYIDLDGSGNNSDREDIVFTFTDSLKSGTSADPFDDRSEIAFNIKGSTAWREISTDDITRTGYFSFMADFLGGDAGSTEMDIEFNIGTRFDGLNFINDSLTTTQYARSSSTVFQNGDGYGAGDLQGVDVASDGTMTGIYSNGELIPLFRVGLARFLNNQGLSSEGSNLFMETRSSGEAITNRPGENGLGTISPNSLEMSNVDISEEFVKMITTQRGFQANSKTITTVDTMMNTVIQMKQ